MFTLRKSQRPEAAKRKQLSVVVADDVHEIQDLLNEWLKGHGHEVTCVSSGRELIDLVRERPIDLVITDLVMPGVDGLDAILAVNRLRPSTRILAISGGGRKMPVEAGLRLARGVGADAVLQKPFDRAQLLAAVDRVAGA